MVDKLIRHWDETLLEPLIVSFRDGKYYVVDGQNRISAIRKMNGDNDVMVMCRVFSGLSYEQEAEFCYRLDKAKHRLTLAQSTVALLESGSSPEIVEICRILKSQGFTWALKKCNGGQHEIVAARAVINTYRLLGGPGFSRMLALLENTWHGDPNSLCATMLSGMGLFLKTYDTELKDAVFAQRLAVIDPEEIIRRSKTDFSTSSASLRVARVLLEKYNKGLRGGNKLSNRLNG